MKYLVSLCLLCTNLLSTAGGLRNNPTRTIEEVSDGIIVTYLFDNPEIVNSRYYENTKYIRYAGFGLNDKDGEPCIPFRNDTYLVPNNCAVSVVILDSAYIDTTFALSPSMPIIADNDSPVFKHSITPYTGFFPSNVLQSSGVYQYREDALISISISPVKYNYMTNTVRRYTLVKYKLTFSGSNYEYNGSRTSLAKNICQNTLLRPSNNAGSVIDNKHYLIITTTEYQNSINEFVKWKRLKGNNVHIVSRPKGNWTIQSVKDSIQSYHNGYNIKYLLIIGGVNDVPAIPYTYYYVDKGDTIYIDIATDYEYGLPSANGAPQIFRGRIPADNTQEVATILNKIIQYEKNPVIDDDFYETGLNCAEFQDKNNDGYEDVCCLLTSENIRSHLLAQDYQVHRQYVKTSSKDTLRWSDSYSHGEPLPAELQPDSFLWNGNSNSIASYINNGVFYALHRDHGLTYGWYHPSFTTNDLSLLHNGNKLPIIFSLNCSTGVYDSTGDCFAEAFLKKGNGGCVAIIAPTGISFSGYNDALALGMFDAVWPNLQPAFSFKDYSDYSNTPVPTYELGQILDQGLFRMGETYGLYERMKLVTYNLFHCFGDPSMRIYTDTPQNFAEPMVYSRNDSIFVFAEDGDCNITFYDKVTKEVKSYKGNHAAYANPSDSLVICLDRHNYVPYIWDFTKDVYIQNENIQGETRVYKGNIIYVGNNVTSTKPIGDVNIQNSHITIQGNRLELHSGIRIDKNFIYNNR